MLSGSHVFLAGSLSAEGKSLTASCQPPWRWELCRWGGSGPRLRLLGFLWFPRRGGGSTARAEARAVRQAEPPARLQRFPASVLLSLADDGCSDEGTRLLRGLSSLQGEGKVVSRCVHTCVHGCVCALPRSARPCGRACVGLSRCHRKGCGGTGGMWCQASPGLGQPRQRVLRPSVCSFTCAKVLLSHSTALIPVPDPECQVSGPIIPGEAQLGRGSIFFKCLRAASEIPSPNQANHSICAFRSLKIHGILPALGVAGAVHQRRGWAHRCQPSTPACDSIPSKLKGCGALGPWGCLWLVSQWGHGRSVASGGGDGEARVSLSWPGEGRGSRCWLQERGHGARGGCCSRAA